MLRHIEAIIEIIAPTVPALRGQVVASIMASVYIDRVDDPAISRVCGLDYLAAELFQRVSV